MSLEAFEYGNRLRAQLYGEAANESVLGLPQPELKRESKKRFRKWLQEADVFPPEESKERGFDTPETDAENGTSRDICGLDEDSTALGPNNNHQIHNLSLSPPHTPVPKRIGNRKRKLPAEEGREEPQQRPPNTQNDTTAQSRRRSSSVGGR